MNTEPQYEEGIKIPIHKLETSPTGEEIFFAEYNPDYISIESKHYIEEHIQQVKEEGGGKTSQVLIPIDHPEYKGASVLFDKEVKPQFLLFSKEIDKQLGEKIKQKELEEKCLIDPLTGLVNRRRWDRELEILSDKIDRNESDKYVSIVMLDLNNLKIINDREGHSKGDETLKELSEVLKQIFRSKDVISRWGGDEFAILATSNENITDIIKRRLENSITPNLSYCAGIYTEEAKNIISGSNNSLEEMVKKSDELLIRAKEDASRKIQNGFKPTIILTNQEVKYASE